TPTEKHARRTEHMSIPHQRWTVHFTWALTSCPLLLGGPGGRTFQDGKRQRINSSRPQACVCVCVCRLHIFTCVFQCVIKKPDKIKKSKNLTNTKIMQALNRVLRQIPEEEETKMVQSHFL